MSVDHRTIEREVCPRCQNVWANCPTFGRCQRPECLEYIGREMAKQEPVFFFTNHPDVDV